MGRRVQERRYEQATQDARTSALGDRDAEGAVPSVPRGATGPPAGPAGAPMLDQLARLTVLHDQGALTDEEFGAAKARVLGNLSQTGQEAPHDSELEHDRA
jgi:Short C-terminal domain